MKTSYYFYYYTNKIKSYHLPTRNTKNTTYDVFSYLYYGSFSIICMVVIKFSTTYYIVGLQVTFNIWFQITAA